MSFRPSAFAMNPQHRTDFRFVLGALVALAVLAAFVFSLYLLAS